MAGCNLPSTPSSCSPTVRPVGIYLARVLEGERTWLDPVLRPFERLIYKLCGVNAEKEMNWREYAFAMLGFSAVTLVLTYAIERLQAYLPWNPQHLAAVGTDLAWNTAASFTTNTNWQFYTPESHHELSHRDGRPGHAQLLVGGRGHRGGRGAHPRHQAHHVRHHRQLLGRHDAHAALHPCAGVHHLRAAAGGAGRAAEPARLHTWRIRSNSPSQTQTIGQGPVASQEAIKMLGTNGGGFFNANSSHPYENPTPFSNFIQILSIFIIPARAHLHAGPHDRLAGPRLGGVCGHVRAVRRRLHRLLLG